MTQETVPHIKQRNMPTNKAKLELHLQVPARALPKGFCKLHARAPAGSFIDSRNDSSITRNYVKRNPDVPARCSTRFQQGSSSVPLFRYHFAGITPPRDWNPAELPEFLGGEGKRFTCLIENHGDSVTPHVDDMGPLLYLWWVLYPRRAGSGDRISGKSSPNGLIMAALFRLVNYYHLNCGFHKWWYPKTDGLWGKSGFEVDDFVPPFQETSKWMSGVFLNAMNSECKPLLRSQLVAKDLRPFEMNCWVDI